MNIWDILIVLVIAGIAAFARRGYKKKNSCHGGCGSCGCGCEHCSKDTE